MLRTRLLGLVLLDHDQPVASLVQRVQFNARFVVDPGGRLLEGRDHPGTMLGMGKAVTTTTMLMSDAPPAGVIPSLVRGHLAERPEARADFF
jgi:hypothetical protein